MGNLTQEMARELRARIADVVDDFADEHDLLLKERITADVSLRGVSLEVPAITLNSKSSDGHIQDEAKIDFEMGARMKGIPNSWYQRVINDRRAKLRIDEIHMNRPKNCIGVTDIHSGKQYVVSKQWVERHL